MLQYVAGFNNYVVFDSNKYIIINTHVFKAWVSGAIILCFICVSHQKWCVEGSGFRWRQRLSSWTNTVL